MSLAGAISQRMFGRRDEPDRPRPIIDLAMLSQFMPWRAYDKQKRRYLNRASHGFIVELPPMLGGDERSGEIIAEWISGLPKGACVQVLSWSSPRISDQISRWFMPRFVQGGVFEKMARYRSELLLDGVWTSLSNDAPFHTRNHRVYVSVGSKLPGSVDWSEMNAIRDGLGSSLRAINLDIRDVTPVDLIKLVDDLTSPTTSAEDDPVEYNEYDSIADQAIRRDIQLEVEEHRLLLRTERFRPTGGDDSGAAEIGEVYPDQFDIRHFGVKNFPQRWAPWECSRLIGDMFIDKLRLPCPAATFLCIVVPDAEASSANAGFKFMRTTSLADSKGARFMPNIRQQSGEWQYVQDQLKEGRKLVQVFYGVTIFSPLGKGDADERTVKSMYKSAGWDLADERFLQIQGLLAALPLTLADGLDVDLKRLKRLRTFLSSTAANIAPMQGEYLGGTVPHLLLLGRRGQPFYWSPFENKAGNHNVAIMGKSGSGKSVLLQEKCAALVGAGAKVVVIDDGRSFMTSCKLQGGQFIEFTMASGFCINPFSMIDAAKAEKDEDYKLDSMAMLKSMVGQMCRFIDRLNDTERGLIDGAVNKVWNEKSSTGTVNDVAAALREEQGNQVAADLATAMRPFLVGGTYGAFFEGQATLRLEGDFTVFELSDLSTREELRSVVLTAIMFMTTQMMTHTSRSVKKLLLIDEAWQMLKGGSMADFVEVYARTCRKYGGALATATQSLNDYYKSDGAKAALENSDWMLILQQKPETIADFKKHERLEMDGATETVIRSLKRNGTEYSEVFIKGPDMQAVGRLCLDKYSATVFSSSPETFARIEQLTRRGMSIDSAIEHVAFPYEGENYAVAAE